MKKKITINELQNNKTLISLYGKVYDIKNFEKKHPGGIHVLR
jgi:cytochrome b involved in lipid metabolism